MFFVTVLAVWTLMHVYVCQRLISAFRFKRWWRIGVIALFVLLWNGLILSRLLEQVLPAALARPVDLVTSDWFGILFLEFTCLLGADIVTAFGFWWKEHRVPVRRWALLAGLLLSFVAIVQGARAPKVVESEVRINRLPAELDGKVVVLATDFHVGTTLGKNWLGDRVSQINALRPDLVVLAGDMVEGHGAPSDEIRMEFARLSAPLGVWAVNGNHERYGRSANFLQGAGINILRNEWKPVAPRLVIAGVDDQADHRMSANANMAPVRAALGGIPSDSAVIFVSHTPSGAEAAADLHAGLMLAGHTHNGQIWPFNYVVRMFFPRVHGRYEVNGMTLIVCAGTGTWGPRMRLWSRGEIVRVVLRSANS